jgi:hypothetical protein
MSAAVARKAPVAEPAKAATRKPSASHASPRAAEPGKVPDDLRATATPAVVKGKPTFEPPAMPPSKISEEELAAADAKNKEAEAALDAAGNAGGVVGAFADAPPGVKAAVQGRVGARIQQTVDADSQSFTNALPKLDVTMGGDLDTPAKTLRSPVPRDLALSQADPTKLPQIPKAPAPTAYQGNAQFQSVLEKLFQRDERSTSKSLDAVKTRDPDLPKVGKPPGIPMERGSETDPQRTNDLQAETKAGALGKRDEAIAAVVDGPGPEQAKLKELREQVAVAAPLQPQVEPLEGDANAAEYATLELEPEVRLQFDRDQEAPMRESLADARAETGKAESERDAGRQAALDDAETQRKAAVDGADRDQRKEVLAARQTIQSERQSTIDAQEKAVVDLDAQADKARKVSRKEIDDRVEADQKSIDKRFEKAETDVEAQAKKGERDAEELRAKAKRDASKTSWWKRAWNWVKSAFDKLTAAIGKVFTAIREAASAIIDKVRDFAKDLIDKAASFLKKAIGAFGTLLKGMVNVLLADTFPGLAKKLNDKIDSAVATAQKGVDVVADKLKKGVDAIADGLKAGLDAVLKVFEGALKFAVSLAKAAITGDWSEVFRKILNAALDLLGIDPADFYAFIDKVLNTLGAIVRAPGRFLGNLLDAVWMGFELFSTNFLKHLRRGVVTWLTGNLGDLKIPDRFDLAGVLDLGRQVLGLTWDWVKERAAKAIGPENMEKLEPLLSWVDTLVNEGWPGVFERVREELSDLAESILGQIKEVLLIDVIKAGIVWLASLFTPVGALVKVVQTVWNLYNFLRNQIQRILGIARAVVDSLDRIVKRVLDQAAEKIEGALGDLVPVALDLLASLLNLTGIGAAVRGVIQGIRKRFTDAVDRLIAKVVAKLKPKPKGKGKGKEEVGSEGQTIAKEERKPDGSLLDGELGKAVKVPTAAGDHTLRVGVRKGQADVMLHSAPTQVLALLESPRYKTAAASNPETQKLWDTAWALASTTEVDAEKLLQLVDAASQKVAKGKATAVPAAAATTTDQQDEKVEGAQEKLALALVKLFAKVEPDADTSLQAEFMNRFEMVEVPAARPASMVAIDQVALRHMPIGVVADDQKRPGFIANLISIPQEFDPGQVVSNYLVNAWQGSDLSELQRGKRTGIVAGINLFESLIPKKQEEAVAAKVAASASAIGGQKANIAIFGFLWRPNWKEKAPANAGAPSALPKPTKADPFERAREVLLQLPADQWLTIVQKNEKAALGKGGRLPLGTVRENVLVSAHTQRQKDMLKAASDPIYLAFGDADVHSMVTSGKKPVGVLTRYTEVLQQMDRYPLMIAGGYRFGWNKYAPPDGVTDPEELQRREFREQLSRALTDLANELDRAIRDGIAEVFPEMLYPTEPNLLFRIYDQGNDFFRSAFFGKVDDEADESDESVESVEIHEADERDQSDERNKSEKNSVAALKDQLMNAGVAQGRSLKVRVQGTLARGETGSAVLTQVPAADVATEARDEARGFKIAPESIRTVRGGARVLAEQAQSFAQPGTLADNFHKALIARGITSPELLFGAEKLIGQRVLFGLFKPIENAIAEIAAGKLDEEGVRRKFDVWRSKAAAKVQGADTDNADRKEAQKVALEAIEKILARVREVLQSKDMDDLWARMRETLGKAVALQKSLKKKTKERIS